MGFIKDSKQMQWAPIEEDEHCPSFATTDSISSSSSAPSSDLTDDASSPSRGPLYDLAGLMAQLPIKRGLSKFYNGKSQTFASLSNVESVEDLGKKETMSFSKRMKSCKSFGGNLNVHQQQKKLSPKATIAKRSSSPKTTCLSSSFAAKTNFFVHTTYL